MIFDRPSLVVIVGATASGKTALSLALAQAWGSPILNGDSRQVYVGMDIGTAKPTPAERALCPHELWDLRPPTHPLTLAEYQRLAQARISHYHQQGITPIVVGGSGLYVQAITAGLGIPPVAPQPELRAQLGQLGQFHCYQLLQHLDPQAARGIHPHDWVRTQRALEVFYVTGMPISRWQRANPPDYPIYLVGLEWPRAVLYERIAQRTLAMVAQGWVEEVRRLRQQYGSGLPLLHSLGYGEISAYLDGQISLEQAQGQIIRKTRHFAKQQLTWFRHKCPGITWFAGGDPGLREGVEEWLGRAVAERGNRLPSRPGR
ncbi:MAG: tRNA (adenosine(37)-N6)-dimethylallyltransferase MiaA [Thermostichales cyanobacterium BF4_bins_65]